IWEYLGIAASDERIRNGRQMLRKHRALFNTIEQAFGVEPDVISAIWGLETGYGVVMGDTPVIPALATLAFAGRRAGYFESELFAALRLVQLGKICVDQLTGSWCGAIGHGQFMPSTVLEFGVDLDADGMTDLCGQDPTDALASVANYLKKHGWRKGQPWGIEVRLPHGFDHALTGLDQTLPARDWSAMGVVTVDGGQVPDYGVSSVLMPAGATGAALLTTNNFHVILRYNKAISYAIGIGHLSDRLVGGKPFVANWPVGEREFTSGDISEAQYLLSRAGFDTLGIDGMIGPNTTRAARAYQTASGLVADGYVGPDLLDRLRGDGR
ncbi:MAG TPA: lytic murein transglycosylase, partial [Rhodobacteraceae bacterium]|nr:lytic murein transglycosylase [Paracoccaceae bacterium]